MTWRLICAARRRHMGGTSLSNSTPRTASLFLYIPIGSAHGLCTLAENVTVAYKVSDTYAPDAEAGVLWSDPMLAIAWPVRKSEAVVSERDRRLPLRSALEPIFA